MQSSAHYGHDQTQNNYFLWRVNLHYHNEDECYTGIHLHNPLLLGHDSFQSCFYEPLPSNINFLSDS